MMDMGLLPSDLAQTEPLDDAAVDFDEDGTEEQDDVVPDAIGLIGHFEASALLALKGKEGPFRGSLDMSMTTQNLVSTEEGVGEMCCCSVAVRARSLTFATESSSGGPAVTDGCQT